MGCLPKRIHEPNISLFIFCRRFERSCENTTASRLRWSTQRALARSSELGQPLHLDRRITYVLRCANIACYDSIDSEQRRVSPIPWMKPQKRLDISQLTNTKRYRDIYDDISHALTAYLSVSLPRPRIWPPSACTKPEKDG